MNLGFLRNDATLNNSGTMVGGQIANSGTLNNNAGGVLSDLSTFSNAGSLNNNTGATLSLGSLTVLTNTNTVSNSGSFTIAGPDSSGTAGTLDNYGSLFNQPGGAFLSSGNLNAYGSSSGTGARIENDGNFDNGGVLTLGGAQASASTAALLINRGTLNNSGQIIVSAGFYPHSGGQLQSYGELNNLAGATFSIESGSRLQVGFLDVPVPSRSFTNQGLMFNSGEFTIDAQTSFINKGTANNNNLLQSGGALSNSGLLRNNVQLNNSGMLTNQGGAPGSAAGTFDNAGQLMNAAAFINGGGSGAGAGGAVLNNHGSIDNRALIDNQAGTLGGQYAVLNNFGVITNSDPGSELRNGGVLNNSGSLSLAAGSTMTNGVGGQLANLPGGTVTVAGTMTNDGSITNAASFVIAAGASVQGGGTYLQTAGTTRVDGELSANSIQMLAGSVTGSGTIDPPVPILIGAAAAVRPGAGIGRLTFIGDTLFDGELDIEVAGSSSYDVLKVIGNLRFEPGARILINFAGYAPQPGAQFVFVDAGAIDSVDVLSFSVAGLPGDFQFNLTLDAEGDLRLTTLADVPEPSTWRLTVMGVIFLSIAVRRRNGR